MSSQFDTYTSPLAARNASKRMLELWSPRHKFNTWRRIWLAIAEAQREVTKDTDTPLVTAVQVAELKAVVDRGITDEELDRAKELEAELRHDVMAHVHCLGEKCPRAKPIIHLGCTSQDVVCNADLLIIEQSTKLLHTKLLRAIFTMSGVSNKWRELPTLAFTHYQAAQPTTVGRRVAGWASDLTICFARHETTWTDDRIYADTRGLRGATGTQASYLALFNGVHDRVDYLQAVFLSKLHGATDRFDLDTANGRMMARGAGAQWTSALNNQTYPRVMDTYILADLASIASVLHKIATDIRLLSNRKEIDEPFGSKQIGSSAMPYKRNPMRCERICGLTRFVMNLVGNAYDTAATQWLERTLDDSSNRRLSLPEAFLALDGALDLVHNVAGGLIVHEAMVKKNLEAELPFLATENILMEAVKAGGDRQDLHERIRVHAQEAGHRFKHLGLDNDLIERIRQDPAFASVKDRLTPEDLLDPIAYTGRAVEQTERFLAEVIEPLRVRYADDLADLEDTEPKV
ncbi:MAG: adenylosuccinate lyase [Planctomycetota bacterium]